MSRLRERHPLILVVLSVALVAIALYWSSLRLPIMYDDLLHIRIAKGLDWLTVWLPTADFGFYRPLTFFPLLLIRGLFGHYPAWLLHGLNVVQHALNATLLAVLVWRLWRNWERSLAAGLLLALFPFSFQAVVVYGHNVHPTTAGLILAGLHGYLNGLETGRKRWWALTALLFVLSLLSHETGILFGPLAALVQWIQRRPQIKTLQLRSLISDQPWLAFCVLGGLYAVAYQLLPVTAGEQVGGPGAFGPKLLYLLQAAVYPLAWFGQLIPNVEGSIIVLASLVVTLALTLWSGRQPERRWPLTLAWGWWGLASVVIALPLQTDYLLHGPRLLYLGGVGLAVLWPLLLEPLRGSTLVGRWAWWGCLLVIMAAGWRFVRDRLDAYEELTEPVAVMQEVMGERPADEGVLLVNLPEWIAPERTVFPVGSEHVAMLGYHLFAEELVAENLGDRPVRLMVVADVLGEVDFPYAVFEPRDWDEAAQARWMDTSSQVFVTQYLADGVQTKHVGQIRPTGGASLRVIASMGGYQLGQIEAVYCAGETQVESSWHWAMDTPPPATASLFVQLLTASGQLAVQADGPPLGLRADLLAPAADWLVTDIRELYYPDGDAAELLVGVYDYSTGERFPAVDGQGQPLPDNALRVPVVKCEQTE